MVKLTSSCIVLMLLCPLLLSSLSIQAAKASPEITIDPNGNVVPETPLIQRLGYVYTFTGDISDSINIQTSNITIDGNGHALTGPGSGTGILLSGSIDDVNNVTIRNLRITNFERGIDLDTSSYNIIRDNFLNSTKQSIFVDDSSFNNISGNVITNPNPGPLPTYGIWIAGSSYNNIIYDNEITKNDYGIYLIYSSLNTISKNHFVNNYNDAIFISSSSNPLYSSFDDVIADNTIAGSSTAGIYFQGTSHHITVLGNTIQSNNRGIYLEPLATDNIISGNTIAQNTKGVYFNNSTDNSIYENNFLDNAEQISYQFPGFVNFFNSSYPVGGNFWSDYTGVDLNSGPYQNLTGSDALTDEPRIIDAYNVDSYPLISRFSGFQASRWYRVNVISNSTVQDLVYFNQNSTIRILATNSSVTQSVGFMRVTIPKGLVGPPYTIKVDAGATTILNLNDPLYDDATTRWIYLAYPQSTREITIQGVPDTTLPTVSILSPQPRLYNTRDVPLTFTVSEPTSLIRYSLDGQNNITISGNTTILGLADGAHTLTVYANDRAANDGGNVGSSPTISFSVEATPPVVQIISPENKTYGPKDISLSFTVNEPVSWLRYSLDGQSNNTITGNTTLSGLSDGPHTVVVYANDTAGNIGNSATVHFSIDATPPTIGILSPENRTYEARGLPLTFTLSEATSWIGYSLDNNANATINGNTTITNLLNGSHTVVIYANDTFGNMGRSNKVYWTVQITSPDTTSPIIQLTSPGKNETYTTTTSTVNVPLTFAVNEQVTWIAYSLDHAPNITVTGNATLTALPLGWHRIVVYALDTAGNAGASEIRYFKVEQAQPGEPFPPTWLIVAIAAIIIIVVVAVIVFYVRRRRRTRR